MKIVAICFSKAVRRAILRALAWGLFACSAWLGAAPALAAVGTPGSAGVSPSGAASYAIPLFVVKGTAGMQPSLALNYSSQGGDGLLGPGWSLAGLSVITVCPKTPAQDGVNGTIDFGTGNHAYCLDGKRLIALAESTGCGSGETEYRTEIESFTRVCRLASPTRFVAQTKSGLMMEYGTTEQTRIEAAGRTDGAIMVWALSRVYDTKTNYMEITYAKNTAVGEYWPTAINYTGNSVLGSTPYAKVEFEYATLTDARQIKGYVGGSRVTVARHMTAIQMKQGDAIARRYALGYSFTGVSQRPRLVSVTEMGKSGDTWSSKRPTTFEYNGDGFVESNFQAAGYSHTQSPQNHDGGDYEGFASYLGDFNGDGILDVFWHREDANRRGISGSPSARLWLGVGPNNSQVIDKVAGMTHCAPIIGDFNGDGRSDILWYPKHDTYHWRNNGGWGYWATPCSTGNPMLVQIGNGNGTFTDTNPMASPFWSNAKWRPYLGDFNGDGKTDILWVMSGDGAGSQHTIVYFWYGAGNGTFTQSDPATIELEWAPVLGDYNGDGATDILWDKKMADGRSAGYRTLWMSNGTGGWVAMPNVMGMDGCCYGGYRMSSVSSICMRTSRCGNGCILAHWRCYRRSLFFSLWGWSCKS